MTRKLLHSFLILFFMMFAATLAGFAQEKPKEIKKTPIQHTSPASGKEMYTSYCAPCHGKDGKGDGPAASALKVPPVNLTLLAKKNGGAFPSDHISSVLRSGTTAAHGSTDMPIWGPLFSSVSGRNDAIVQMRIGNLIKYLESIQEK